MENLLGLEGDKNDSPVNYFVTFLCELELGIRIISFLFV